MLVELRLLGKLLLVALSCKLVLVLDTLKPFKKKSTQHTAHSTQHKLETSKEKPFTVESAAHG